MIYILGRVDEVLAHICGRGKITCICGESITFEGDFESENDSNTKFSVEGNIRIGNEKDNLLVTCGECSHKMARIEIPATGFDLEHIDMLEKSVVELANKLHEMTTERDALKERVEGPKI